MKERGLFGTFLNSCWVALTHTGRDWLCWTYSVFYILLYEVVCITIFSNTTGIQVFIRHHMVITKNQWLCTLCLANHVFACGFHSTFPFSFHLLRTTRAFRFSIWISCLSLWFLVLYWSVMMQHHWCCRCQRLISWNIQQSDQLTTVSTYSML